MEVFEVLDANNGPSIGQSMQSCSHLQKGDGLENDSGLDRKVLEDLDSYWDELSARLTVSRMVSNCVTKGIANAIAEEAAENIASKEAEVAFLHKKLDSYASIPTGSDRLDLAMPVPEPLIVAEEFLKTKLASNQCIPDAGYQKNCSEQLDKLKIAAEGQLQMLKKEIGNTKAAKSLFHQGKVDENVPIVDGYINGLELVLAAIYKQVDIMSSSLKFSASEKLWEQEFQRELSAIMFQDVTAAFHDEHEKKLCDLRSHIHTLNKIWQQKIAKLSDIRQELGSISSCLNSSETWVLFSHNSTENTEEFSVSKRMDHFPQSEVGSRHLLSRSDPSEEGSLSTDKVEESVNVKTEVGFSPQLQLMKKEDLIAYFKTGVTKMKRQHELALQEKTEELFCLKREFLKEKGSNCSHFRNNKEFELLRKKIPELNLKLDDILLEKKFPIVDDDHDIFCCLKDRIDNLLVENERLQTLLTDKSKEVKDLSSQFHAVNQTSHHPLAEANFQEQIEILKSEVENVKIEASIRNEVHSTALKELVDKHATELEALQMESMNSQEIYSIISREAVHDAISSINTMIASFYVDKDSTAKLLLEKQRNFCLQVEENKKLEKVIASLSALVKEKEKLALESGSVLEWQNERLEKMNQEITVLREQVSKQTILLLESKVESNSAQCRLDETLQQIHQYEVEANELKVSTQVLYKGLEEAKKQKSILEGIIQEKENLLSSFIERENQQKQHMKSVMLLLLSELSKAFANLESRLTPNIEQNQSRLNILSHQCSQLVLRGNLQKKTGLLCKQMYDRKCSDLQKAEIEVDLLANDVDTLMSLLEMIYIALDHYSSVFKYYPPVMEILKLTGRELKKRYS